MITIGQTLNNTYEVIEQLGSGSGGIIFKAYHKRMQKYVAIKLIKDEIKGGISTRSEVDVLKNLKNDYLPQVLDFVEDGDDVYTVMEFVEGRNFKQLIQSGMEFDEKRVRKYAVQLCDAVEYLHGHKPPIIHSDIKPANIMLTPDDNIVLIDFNISMMSRNGIAVSKGGSRDFAAPEQFRRVIKAPVEIDEFHEETRFIDSDETEIISDIQTESRQRSTSSTKNVERAYIDIRTDIYGIGASLYYILTGRVPQGGRLDFRGVRCSSLIREIISKAMDPDPQKRYKNISEMKRALKKRVSVKPFVMAGAAVVGAVCIAVGITAVSEFFSGRGEVASASVDTGVTEGDTVTVTAETTAGTTVDTTAARETTTAETTVETTTTMETTTVETTTTSETTTAETTTTTEATTEITTVKSENAPVEETDYITIKGERYSTSLTRLNLSSKNLTDDDIKELYKMKKLTFLSLESNQISDISSLEGLTMLTKLWLDDNQISDISALSGLFCLEVLDLENNQISDIGVLSGLTSIKRLYLRGNKISDISALSGLTNLWRLYLGNNQISDIGALSGLTNIVHLHLSGTKISDISVLRGLTQLTWLDLSNNQISESDIENLRTLLPNCEIHS